MARAFNNESCTSWKIGVDQEAHEGSAGQEIKLFPVDQLVCKFEGRADVFSRHAVFGLDLRESHPACEATHDSRNRNTRPSNDRLAVLYLRINDDSIVHGFNSVPKSTASAGHSGASRPAFDRYPRRALRRRPRSAGGALWMLTYSVDRQTAEERFGIQAFGPEGPFGPIRMDCKGGHWLTRWFWVIIQSPRRTQKGTTTGRMDSAELAG